MNTSTLSTTILSTQTDIDTSRDQVVQLDMEAEGYRDILNKLDVNLDRAAELVQNGSAQVGESEKFLNQVNDNVHNVEAALSTLNSIDTSELQNVLVDLQSRLSSLESDISSKDVERWYTLLYEQLSEQKVTRQKLERSLMDLQDEVEQLEHLESMLPQACDSNL